MKTMSASEEGQASGRSKASRNTRRSRPLRFGPACYHVLHLTVLTAAHEMNFFYDEGLHDENERESYEIVPHGLAPFSFEKLSLVQAMKDKEVHIATDVQPRTALYLSSQGEDLCVIAGWRNNRGRSLVARRELGTLQDLRGRRIGISDMGDNHHLLLCYWLDQAGVNPRSEVQWVTGIGPEMRLRPLLEGKIDAGLVTYRDHIAELQEAGLAILKDFSSAYPDGRPDRVIVSSNRVIDERREEVKAFLRAILRVYWFVRDVQNFRYLQNLEGRLRRQSPNPYEQIRPVHVSSPGWMERHQAYPIDGLATGLEQYANEMFALGEVERKVDLGKVLRQELAQEAFRELLERPEVRPDLERAREVVKRIGY
ncbi:MAG: ABC transporter substrate-binding protein [Deltaproteobacteria bacterium]|nr:ABC transporter substrate-binding protein [Deltaproteobacteria bacterium]